MKMFIGCRVWGIFMAYEMDYDDVLSQLKKENEELKAQNEFLSQAYEKLKAKITVMWGSRL